MYSPMFPCHQFYPRLLYKSANAPDAHEDFPALLRLCLVISFLLGLLYASSGICLPLFVCLPSRLQQSMYLSGMDLYGFIWIYLDLYSYMIYIIIYILYIQSHICLSLSFSRSLSLSLSLYIILYIYIYMYIYVL